MKKAYIVRSALIGLTAVTVLYFYVGALRGSTGASGDGKRTVIIDAGHGLPDGGAVSDDGKTVESQVNLSVAALLEQKLTDAGFRCIMTRTGENGTYTEGDTIHAKKVSDVRNRVKLAESEPDALVISVHMNTFPSKDVHGAQIFYGTQGGSRDIAREIQSSINVRLQPDNIKKEKPIPANVYLFKHIPNECVLAECGFLSNAGDLEKLRDAEYLDRLASAIAEAAAYKLIGSENDGG